MILLAATSAAALPPPWPASLLTHIAGRTATLVFPLLVAASAIAATTSAGIRTVSQRA